MKKGKTAFVKPDPTWSISEYQAMPHNNRNGVKKMLQRIYHNKVKRYFNKEIKEALSE